MKNSSSKTVVLSALILFGGILGAGLIFPKLLSLEAVMLALIASYLAGIHAEMKRANDLNNPLDMPPSA